MMVNEIERELIEQLASVKKDKTFIGSVYQALKTDEKETDDCVHYSLQRVWQYDIYVRCLFKRNAD